MAKKETGTKDGIEWEYTLVERPAGGLGSGKQYDSTTGEWSTPECVSNDSCWAFFTAKYCVGCYSDCNSKYDNEMKKRQEKTCESCDTGCVSKYESGTQATKQGCTSAYGVCEATCDACESCQGCVECQSFDNAQDAQSSLIKNVDESVTRRARGEGYSKAAANMIGGGSAQDATAQNFNSLAMQQNQAGNTTQADWLSKQGYLDALDQEIKNKKASQGLETVGAFFNF